MAIFENIFGRTAANREPTPETPDENWLQSLREHQRAQRAQREEEEAREDSITLAQMQHQNNLQRERALRMRQINREENQRGASVERAQRQREEAFRDLFESRDRQQGRTVPPHVGSSVVRPVTSAIGTLNGDQLRDILHMPADFSATIQTPSTRQYEFDFSKINSIDDMGKVLEVICAANRLKMSDDAIQKHEISHLVRRIDDI